MTSEKPEGQSYLHWAKTHRRVKYELTDSGVPQLKASDLPITASDIRLRVRGSYGDPELIEAIANRWGVARESVLPVPGASCGIFVALAGAAKAGESVLLEEPGYDPVQRSAEFLNLRIVPIRRRPEYDFALRLDELAKLLAQRPAALFLTNLHNPSGQWIDRGQMADIAVRCAQAGTLLIVDEVYLEAAHLNGLESRWTAAQVGDRVITINSLTKIHGFSGLRTGWVVAPPTYIERARGVMNLLSVNNAAPATALALRVFDRIERLGERFRAICEASAPVYRRWLENEPLVRGYPSRGAIFECVRLPPGVSSTALHERLVREYETQITPGSFFGLDDHIRLSLTPAPDDLSEALSRISQALRPKQ